MHEYSWREWRFLLDLTKMLMQGTGGLPRRTDDFHFPARWHFGQLRTILELVGLPWFRERSFDGPSLRLGCSVSSKTHEEQCNSTVESKIPHTASKKRTCGTPLSQDQGTEMPLLVLT